MATWRRKPPTEPGFYWVCHQGCRSVAEIGEHTTRFLGDELEYETSKLVHDSRVTWLPPLLWGPRLDPPDPPTRDYAAFAADV